MKRFGILALVCCIALTASGCAAEPTYQKFSSTFFDTFDTMIVIMGYALEESTFQAAFDGAKARFTRYHQVYDGYVRHEGVEGLFHLNREAGGGEPVHVEPELMDLLLYVKERQPLTQGKMNVALGTVLSVWHDYREAGIDNPAEAALPPMEALADAAHDVDFDSVILDPEAGTVTFADPDLRLDLGSVAKGYATEQVAQWMLESDMPSFLISAGGNVRVGNPPMDGRLRWGVSIQDPDGAILTGANEDTLDVLFVSNTSVVTSGDYQRYYVVDGVRYHHIIDPDTLMPGNATRSVTIVCEDSGWADILSTAVFLMDYAQGRAYVESLDGVEAFWMLPDGSIEMTDGMLAMSRDFGGATSK